MDDACRLLGNPHTIREVCIFRRDGEAMQASVFPDLGIGPASDGDDWWSSTWTATPGGHTEGILGRFTSIKYRCIVHSAAST
jgi:hypothetical protein